MVDFMWVFEVERCWCIVEIREFVCVVVKELFWRVRIFCARDGAVVVVVVGGVGSRRWWRWDCVVRAVVPSGVRFDWRVWIMFVFVLALVSVLISVLVLGDWGSGWERMEMVRSVLWWSSSCSSSMVSLSAESARSALRVSGVRSMDGGALGWYLAVSQASMWFQSLVVARCWRATEGEKMVEGERWAIVIGLIDLLCCVVSWRWCCIT